MLLYELYGSLSHLLALATYYMRLSILIKLQSMAAKINFHIGYNLAHILSLSLSLPCFFLFFYCILRARRRLTRVPMNWPFLGMLPAVVANLHRLHVWLAEILPEARLSFFFYGPWFFGMNYFITCDPANVHHILTANFPNYPKGEELWEIFDIFGDGIFNADGESWKQQRIKAHAIFSSERYRALVARSVRCKVETSLLPILDQIAEEGSVVDLQDVCLRLTFDLTYYALFEEDLGCLSPGFPTVPFAQAADDAGAVMLFRHVVPPSWWKAMRWLNVGAEKKMAKARTVIDQFIDLRVAEKRKQLLLKTSSIPNDQSKDSSSTAGFISSYIAEALIMKEEISDKFLRDTVVNFLTAGRDATGVGLVWFLWNVCKHPDVEMKIYEELKSIKEKSADSSSGLITFDPDEIKDLVYLHAALCESLRLFTPIPFEHKAAKESDVLPSGHRVGAGTKILIFFHTMARMEAIWGKDCSEFRPERWISEKGSLRYEPSYKFVSFNAGPRTCLGKQMSFTMMKTNAAGIIYNFHLHHVAEEGHPPAVEPKLSIVLSMKNGFHARLTRRSTSTQH